MSKAKALLNLANQVFTEDKYHDAENAIAMQLSGTGRITRRGKVISVYDSESEVLNGIKRQIDDLIKKGKIKGTTRISRTDGVVFTSSESQEDQTDEAVTGDALLKELEQIVKDHQSEEIDGTLVDVQTASLIVQVAKALSPENKAKFLGKGISSAANVAWKLVK